MINPFNPVLPWPLGRRVPFQINKSIDGRNIIEVSELVGKVLIQHFIKNPDELKLVNRRKFEEIVAEIFLGFGYEVELTRATRDGGRDVIAIKRKLVEERFLVECKRPDPGKKVGVRAVRELYGVKQSEGATKALLATTAYFTKDARLMFDKHRWELEGKDYNAIMEWLQEYMKTTKI